MEKIILRATDPTAPTRAAELYYKLTKLQMCRDYYLYKRHFITQNITLED